MFTKLSKKPKWSYKDLDFEWGRIKLRRGDERAYSKMEFLQKYYVTFVEEIEKQIDRIWPPNESAKMYKVEIKFNVDVDLFNSEDPDYQSEIIPEPVTGFSIIKSTKFLHFESKEDFFRYMNDLVNIEKTCDASFEDLHNYDWLQINAVTELKVKKNIKEISKSVLSQKRKTRSRKRRPRGGRKSRNAKRR